MPQWLITISIISLIAGGLSFLIIVIDLFSGHNQPMWIMNVVWPITGLYAGPLALWAYRKVGRVSKEHSGHHSHGSDRPFWQSVGLSATHCGSGCTLGDLIAEWGLVLFPFTLFGYGIFAGWVVDYVLAFIIGIAFQYYTIKPMKNISSGAAIREAIKADTLSLTSWQVGMYGWMAIATFAIFGHELPKTSPVFWFMMQIAMVAGFMTAYPMNWLLLKMGVKEPM